MIYFATPSSPVAIAHMRDRTLGWIDTPNQANIRPDDVLWCADNGCYTETFNETQWWRWLVKHAGHAGMCAFATAPDVLGDHQATLTRSAPWLPRIRDLGYPAAFVAQDGATFDAMPWQDFDVLFIGGTDTFKFSWDAITISRHARRRGKWIHYGRINSQRRWRLARAVGAQSADGTFLKFAPDQNMIRLTRWLEDLHQPGLFTLAGEP